MTILSAPASRAAAIGQPTSGRPQSGCSILGSRERMRVPWPAARMTTVRSGMHGSYGYSGTGRLADLLGSGVMAARHSLEVLVQVRILAPQSRSSVRRSCEHMFVPRYSETEARRAVAASLSYAETLRGLGLCATGGNWRTLRVVDRPLGHRDGSFRFASGATRRSPYSATAAVGDPRGGIELQPQSPQEQAVPRGPQGARCELCGQGELWHGRPMGLILDHVNGVRDDHRIENLRIVCPNCAATLDTHCGRKNRLEPVDRECLLCGVAFSPRYRRQRYCSRECGRALREAVAYLTQSCGASSARRTSSWCARSLTRATSLSGASTGSPTTRFASGCASTSARRRPLARSAADASAQAMPP